MENGPMIAALLTWYVAIQLCALAALPLALRICAPLPDRGFAFAKTLGVFLVAFVLWFGTSYGILRNDLGGAWLALFIVAGSSVWVGREWLRGPGAAIWRRLSLRYVVAVEGLFLVAYLAWAVVRIYDPAANHTEQPMDLMFINAITASPTYPPQDAWLAGYPVSYYYLGYWMLTTLGFLAGAAPAIAYNVGQASWFALLLLGSFGVVTNLLATPDARRHEREAEPWPAWSLAAAGGGLLAATMAGVMGNLQIVLEWLYARGYDIAAPARWFDVDGFPGANMPSGLWYIGTDWWWWRASRVVQDRDLLGNHIEVIDEFPFFSYLLGDNHPHVLAMPVVLLVVGLAYGLLLAMVARQGRAPRAAEATVRSQWAEHVRRLRDVPGGIAGAIVVVVVSGGLLFLNTWDYPPYWFLLVACFAFPLLAACSDNARLRARLWAAVSGGALAGAGLLLGAVIVYFPYLLTAQSQVQGIGVNLFNPTRLLQFLLMFGAFLPAVSALLIVVWKSAPPAPKQLAVAALATFGAPIFFLGVSTLVGINSEYGRARLGDITLPEGASSYLPYLLERWSANGWTLLLLGGLLTVTLALIWRWATRPGGASDGPAVFFALLLAALGLGLVYVPEFVYLRDNFGTRMNTVFKFYYQAWLLLALAGSFAVAAVIAGRGVRRSLFARGLAFASLALVTAGLLYPAAGVVAKTNRFAATDPTLDASAYVGAESPDVMAAVAWIRANTAFDAMIAEARGKSYLAAYSRISALTGRPTLLGWEGHESQWRGAAYGAMAAGRADALEAIYRSARPEELPGLLDRYGIDYVFVGPTERSEYAMNDYAVERLDRVFDLVFQSGDVRIYGRRS